MPAKASEPITKIQDLILNTALSNPEKVCLKQYDEGNWLDFTYQELINHSNSKSEKLKKAGIQAGDRIGIISETSFDAITAFLAGLSSGATMVLLDPGLPTCDLQKIVEKADCKLLLISKKALSTNDASNFKSTVSSVWELSSFVPRSCYTSELPSIVAKDINTNIACILFTSGTTGSAKGVMLSHENFLYSLKIAFKASNINSSDVGLNLLPFHHVVSLTQCVLYPLYIGSKTALLSTLRPNAINKSFVEIKPTYMVIVPRILELLNQSIELKIKSKPKIIQGLISVLKSTGNIIFKTLGIRSHRYLLYPIHKKFGGRLRLLFCGAAPVPKNLEEKMSLYGFNIITGYGLTETTAGICLNKNKKRKVGTVGTPVDGTNIFISKPDKSGIGEVVVEGPSVALGYFRDQESTAKVFHGNKFYTGDLGFIDGEGFLKITGRIKDIIVTSGGKKVMPLDVENHYMNIPHINSLYVVGIVDQASMGEKIHAAVVIDDKVNLPLEEIKSKIKNLISRISKNLPSHYKISQFHLISQDELPFTTSMKIQRVKLKTLIEKIIIKSKSINHKTFRVSDNQKRYFEDQIAEPDVPRNNLSLSIKFNKPIDVDILKKSCRELISQNNVLRSNFLIDNGEYKYFLNSTNELEFSVINITESEIKDEITKLTRKVFDMTKDPLIRFYYIENENIFVCCSNHLIMDGKTFILILKEIFYNYNLLLSNEKLPHKKALQYEDYISWQTDALASEESKRVKDYWEKQLSNIALSNLSNKLPTYDKRRGDRLLQRKITLTDKDISFLNTFMSENNLTVTQVIFALYCLFIKQLIGDADIIIQTPYLGRIHSQFSQLIGCFNSTLPIRVVIEKDYEFLDIAVKAKTALKDANKQQLISYDDLVKIRAKNSNSNQPVFQLRSYNFKTDDIAAGDAFGKYFSYHPGDYYFDLCLTVIGLQDIEILYPVSSYFFNNSDNLEEIFLQIVHQLYSS